MASPQPDLTTEAGLSAYLTSHSTPHTSVALLTGGTTNYVYRVTNSDSPKQNKTYIYKHSAPHLNSNPSYAFDSARMDYENRVLTILPEFLDLQLPRNKTIVHAVEPHSYDAESRVLCLEDGGERELKKSYTDPLLNIPQIGTEIGKWLAALHTSTKQASLSLVARAKDDPDLKANNSIAVSIYRYSYDNLATSFSKYKHDDDVELAKRINDEFGGRLATENECICHGDFWPGNILVKFQDEQQQINKSNVLLTVVDWEITRRGTSATDVGQFAAEAFLLDRFRGNKGLLEAFLNSYIDARDLNTETAGNKKGDLDMDMKEWLRRVVVHWAVHVAFWPTLVKWTDEEGTRRLVDMGVAVLKAVLDGDVEGLRECELLRCAGEKFLGLLGLVA